MTRASLGLVSLLLGCGSVVGPHNTDAATGDGPAGPDADLTGMATMVTHTHVPGYGASGAIQAMVDLVSLRPNGSVLEMARSDATGQAMIHVYPGGSVTAIYPHMQDMGTDFVTYMGVKPGDTLTFGQEFTPSTNQNLGAMTLSWPARAGASFYDVYTPCGGYGAGASTSYGPITEFDYCHKDPMFVLVAAYDSAGNVLGFSQNYVSFQAGGSSGLSGWSTPTTTQSTITQLPTDVMQIYGYWYMIANGGRQMWNQSFGGTPSGGAFTGNIMQWPGGGDRTMAQLQMCRQGNFSCMDVLDGLQSNATTWTVANPTLPPWDSGRIASAAAKIVTWFPIGQPTHAGNTVWLQWGRSMSNMFSTFNWYFITPPDVSAFNLPTMPAAFAPQTPQVDDGMYINQVEMIASPSIADYDAFRALPESEVICTDCAVREGLIQRIVRSN